MIIYPSYDYCANVSCNNRSKSLHGCFILYNRRIISSGRNDSTRNCIKGRYGLSIHSEMTALNALNIKNVQKKKLHMVVVRYTRDGKLADSKPCNQCFKLIQDYNINTVTYSMIINNQPYLITQKTCHIYNLHTSSGYRFIAQQGMTIFN